MRFLVASTFAKPEKAMTRRRMILMCAVTAVLGATALGVWRARDVPKVATGFVAGVLCSGTFVSGLDPEKVFVETTAAMPGAGLINWALDYKLDHANKNVIVAMLGFGRSQSVYRDGLGCHLDHGNDAVRPISPSIASEVPPALLPDIAGPEPVAPQGPELAAALDRAFAEPAQPPFRRTKAVVVVKNGHIVAERYADGYGIDTPILGFSATKSSWCPASRRLLWPGRAMAIHAMPLRSINCCGTPQASRLAVRSRPRLARRSNRSTA
jgi:hypothetical protein